LSTKWSVYLWDLDGTITDPRLGIIGAYQALYNEWGKTPPDEKDLLWVIGPPIRDCFKTLLQTDDKDVIEKAVARYRYWYVTEGLMYRDTPYPGIGEILKELRRKNVRLFVATAKAHIYAREILKHWGLSEYFEDIHGSELDGTRSNKAELLEWIMNRYQLDSSSNIVMIGDRKHDMIAGIANGLSTVGVGYGYGSRSELQDAGAQFYCENVLDLKSLLLQN
jgi:phosphoglycolate phosphatase